MFTQNISGAYQNNSYIANRSERNSDVISQTPANDEYAVKNEQGKKDVLSLSGNAPKILATPTKIYVDKVINNALDNIARGNNIEDNKRIVRLYSNLIRENPEKILLKAYNL